ncbi:MAG TPA: hypothetical protein VIK45_10035 [Candidatus Dormibacteraeota bacterium]
MRGLAAALCALVLAALVGCGAPATRSQADQDKDGKAIAAAIRAADSTGIAFTMDESLALTGGAVPSGQALTVHATSQDGVLKDGFARLSYHVTSGRTGLDYDMVLTDTQLYVKRRGTSDWRTTPLSATTSFFPALRLDLVRETVLLASSISASSLTHVNAGFAHKYAVKPAPDQLEQLQAIVVEGSSETAFLKGASAELDVYTTIPGDNLARVEAHLTGMDPAAGTKQKVDNSMDVRSARVGTIKPPDSAAPVAPEQIFN